jgi:hypothetical protein
MKKASRLVAGFAALGLAFTACGGDDGDDAGITGTTTGDELTQAEALAIFGVLQDAAFDALPSPMASAAAEPISGSSTCPDGGSISISGDGTASGNSVSFDMTQTVSNCLLSVNNIDFTVNGAPSIRIQGNFTASGTGFSGTYAMSGGFGYSSSDNREGTCSVDIDFDWSNFSTLGSICGVSLSTAG